MLTATLTLASRDWLVWATILAVCAVASAVWSYVRAASLRTTRGAFAQGAAFGLKLLGILALAACLLEPLWSASHFKPGANEFVILADNSRSLEIKDRSAAQNRGEKLRAALTDEHAPWQSVLGRDFLVRRYSFDLRVQNTKDFYALKFDGRVSSLGGALRTIGERFKNQPLAGVLLFTDGNATDLAADKLPDLAGLPPVYPVVVGEDAPLEDIALTQVSVSQTTFEDAPVIIDAKVEHSGYTAAKIEAALLDASGKQIEKQAVPTAGSGGKTAVRFQVRPEKPGVAFYWVQVSGAEGAPAEATLENNVRLVAVNRDAESYRILYVGGRPNWEHKFLQRALAEDAQLKLVSLIRIARREPKFQALGRPGESSNPLFRGFGDQDTAQRYDEPVVARLNTLDADELGSGFPRIAEELYRYHAVILDDIEAGFFTHEQLRLLGRFVAERGGGLLMLGGVNSFRDGAWEKTPLADALPVYLDRAPPSVAPGPLQFALSREGLLAPWARLRASEAEERTRLDATGPFKVLSASREIKPGASVIATVTDAQRHEFPAIAVQRFGDGHAAALMIGDFWRWGLQNEERHRDMDKAWRQLIRWLVADVPRAVELQKKTDENATADEAVSLEIKARDRKWEPLENASVTVKVQTPSGGTLNLEATPSENTPGVYETSFVPGEPGAYQAEASVVSDSDSRAGGHAKIGWAVEPTADEFRSLQPNRTLLERIARATGGEIVESSGLEKFVGSLSRRTVPITEFTTTPLWHQPAVFLFALGCFVAEWGLRRWKGLP